MLWGIVVISVAAAAALYFFALSAPPAGATIVWALFGVTVAAVVMAAKFLHGNALVGRIDATGLYLKSYGTQPIPWADIEAFSIDHTAEGGELICIHLRDPEKYYSGLGIERILAATGRQVLGYTPITLVLSTMSATAEDISREMRQHVPERPAA